MNKVFTELKKILVIVLLVIVILYVYTFLHEGGHALTVLLYGGDINSFVLGLKAHISYDNANFTVSGEALNQMAGTALPVLIGMVMFIFYNKKNKAYIYHIGYILTAAMLTGSLLSWVFIPIISLFQMPPQGDDVTKFLNIADVNPIYVSLIALLVMSGLVYLILKKGLFENVKWIYGSIYKPGKVLSKSFICAVVIAACLLMILFVRNKPILERSFDINATIEKQEKIDFKIQKDKVYQLELDLEAQGFITDVRILDENGNLIYQNFGEWFFLTTNIELSKGSYTLELSYLTDKEALKQHLEDMEYEQLDLETMTLLEKIYENTGSNYAATLKVKLS